MKKITPIDIMIALIMISFLFTIFSGCTKVESVKVKTPIEETIKYGDVLIVKKGFYTGCSAKIESRVGHYRFRAALNCPQNPDVIVIAESLHVDNL